VLLGAAWVAGIAAAVASYSALWQLAVLAGWSHRVAFLFPLTIDAYAVAALRVWLSRATSSSSARRRARRAAVGAIVASMAGNATLHAAMAHEFRVTWPVVVAVSAVPPVTLGLVSHLFALRSLPADAELPEWAREPKRELLPAELAALPKSEAIKHALAHTEGAVLAAVAWLADRGVQVDRRYAHDVKSARRKHRRAAVAAGPDPAGEVAA
jgi:hypothetical protein